MFTAAVTASLLHFFLTKRLIQPIRNLSESTEQLKQGHYPEPIETTKRDEIGQLVSQYNGLIQQLQMNEEQRKHLISDLSHEIKTPLSNLNGYLQALKDGDLTGDPAMFASLYQESSRLSQMIEQLEQLKEWDHLSAQHITGKETVNMQEVLKQCAAMFQWTLDQRQIKLQIQAEKGELPVHVEGIQQALSNLLDNAIRYYDGSGPVTLTGENIGTYYRVAVTGPSDPIAAEEKDKIFKRFYRIDSSRSRDTGGTGLGLAITKKIIENNHQGSIGVDAFDNSNTFWLTLPIN